MLFSLFALIPAPEMADVILDSFMFYSLGASIIWNISLGIYPYVKPTPTNYWKWHAIAWSIPVIPFILNLLLGLDYVSEHIKHNLFS